MCFYHADAASPAANGHSGAGIDIGIDTSCNENLETLNLRSIQSFSFIKKAHPCMTVLVTSAMAIYLIVSVAHVFKQEQSRLELIWQTRQNTASLFSMLVLVVCALMEVLIWSVFLFTFVWLK